MILKVPGSMLFAAMLCCAATGASAQAGFDGGTPCARASHLGSKIEERCEDAGRDAVVIEHELELTTRIEGRTIRTSQCQAEVSLSYAQNDTLASVDGKIENTTCGASSGSVVLSISTTNDAGDRARQEFTQTWMRDDDQPVAFSVEYPIGANVDSCVCVRSGCAAPAPSCTVWSFPRPFRVSPHSWLLLPLLRFGHYRPASRSRIMSPTASSIDNTLAYRAFEDTAPVTQLHERAYPGLHAEILSEVLKHVRTRGPLLDLACGTGAWLSRLQQHGFSEVLGTDRDVDAFGLDPANHVLANLDEDYAERIGRTFDVITAIEIIEHVESPADFMREARKLINPGGYMFVTTPNVECIQSRLRFLLKGRLRGFEDDGTADPTHISPLFTSLMPRLATRAGWKIDERIDLLKNASRPSTRFVCRLLSPFLDGDAKQGDCHLFVLRPI